ncbi:MAG: DUF1266 domain-containing protein [Erysipelotrichaceae bacterium]
MRLIKKLKKTMIAEKYRKNPKAPTITLIQQRALNVGAINSQQLHYYCDSFETGSDLRTIKKNLAQYYGIVDKHSALSVINWLLTRGYNIIFESIKDLVVGSSTITNYASLEIHEVDRLNEFLANLEDSIEILIQNNFLKTKSSLQTSSILAWDMGRLVLVARCCGELGYIRHDEVLNFIEQSYYACSNEYNDWNELASGYMIGRAMWSGDSSSLAILIDLTKGLLHDEESPWVTNLFK